MDSCRSRVVTVCVVVEEEEEEERGGERGGGTRTSSQRRMGGVVEGEMVITNSRIRAIGIIGVRINSSGVKFACACIN